MAESARRASLGGSMYWVRAQHDEIQVLHQSERPDSTAKQGERHVRVMGPFREKADADRAAENIRRKTLKGQREGGVK